MTERHPLAELTASELVRAIRVGEVRAESYAVALLEEIHAGDELNAFLSIDPAAVLESARSADRQRSAGRPLGLLHGLPIAVKDSIHTVDHPATNGTAALRSFRPQRDASIIAGIRREGAFVLGKTGLTELSFGWTSNNGTFGAVHNPYRRDLVPGGSSGGSAAAVAARMAPLAIGADTLGSIRIPASFCGVVGFRPSFGRYPNDGAFGLTDDILDQLGPLARSVADVALFDAVFSGAAPSPERRSLAGARIAVPRFYREGIESTVGVAIDGAMEKLSEAGAVLVDVDVPQSLRSAFDVAAAIMLYEAMPSVSRYLRSNDTGVQFDDLVGAMADGKREFFVQVAMPPGRPTRDAYEAMIARRVELRDALRVFVLAEGIDAIALPSVGAPPPPIGEEHEVDVDGVAVSFFDAFGRNTALASATGAPALTLPAAISSTGLPVGLELIALPGADRALVDLGAAVERALGFRAPGRPWRNG